MSASVLLLQVPITDVVSPGKEVAIPNEGMPKSKQLGQKGNLRVRFDVRFPRSLTPQQKQQLRQALPAS